jgi:hypothetical protein
MSTQAAQFAEDVPTFAVVGHPNKGKSSIVATLAQDDSVAIAPLPGTTTRCHAYPMRVDGQVQYVLIDTPGFQRARTALAWMKQRETTAAEHSEVVEDFVREHKARGAYPDECELLSPVLAGAGILYVVDGAVPFAEEYQHEMEILRWTGRPSLALINPIGSDAHVAAWEAALQQYFKVVRVFNAVTAEFDKRVELLRAFGQLRDGWRGPLQRAVDALIEDRRRRHRQAARAIAHMVVDMMTLTAARPMGEEDDPAAVKRELEQRYLDALRRRERDGRETVERCYDHHRLQREEGDVAVAEGDLFASEQWRLFGLSRTRLAMLGAAGGAVTGGGIDAMVGGGSFMAGAVIGTVAGTVSALVGGPRIARVRPDAMIDRIPGGRWLARLPGLNRPIGGRELRVGPCRNINFAYVVLGRAMQHHDRIARRTHADRGSVRLDHAEAPRWHEQLPSAEHAQLRKLLSRLGGGGLIPGGGDAEVATADLTRLLIRLLVPEPGRAA